ncbi:MAG TPA: hypothetical protein DHV05_08200, partial [Acholeplasmataceae bacterium]|nr:hypothetical protein [Acholeplasmataceae bacterium]
YVEPLWIEQQWVDTNHEMIEITEETSELSGPISYIKTAETKWQLPKDQIFKATVIKVIAIHQETRKTSDVITHTYFVSPDMFEKYTFPIVALSTDNHHLFDYETGIHVSGIHFDQTPENPNNNRTGNYYESGDVWEKPVFVEYFLTSGLRVMAQQAGIRIHGGLSRQYPIKSYRLYARSEYDAQNEFNFPFFEDQDIDSFKRLILRNGGQGYQYTFFGDAFLHQLLKPLTLDFQDSRPVIVFINGEYFGIRNLRERLDTNYLEEHYDIKEEQVTLLKGHAFYDDGSKAGQLHYQRMYAYANTNDLSKPNAFHQMERWMDMDNFIDYMAVQIYVGNTDWPQNNILYWRKNVTFNPNAPYGHDGRWRWMINDLDASFGVSFGATKPEINSFEKLTGDSWKTARLFVNLLQNEKFKSRFTYRFLELSNTIFDKDRVVGELDRMILLYEPEMMEHINRFGYPVTYQTWLSYVERMREFALQRRSYSVSDLETYINISSKVNVSIMFDDEKGEVEINGLSLSQSHYDQEVYQEILSELKAIPIEGYHVEGWYLNDLKLSDRDVIWIKPEETGNLEVRFLEGDKPDEPINWNLIFQIGFSLLWTSTSVIALVLVIKKRNESSISKE